MNFADRIEIRPDILLGKPVIRGTRVPVDLIVRKLGEGAREEDLLEAYPRLERADVHAALLYAAAVLANEETILFEPAPSPVHRAR